MNIALIILASLLSCGGQLCQKQAAQGAGRRHLMLWLGLSVLLLGLGMLVWLLVLQHVEVSIAYPMLSLNFIFITLAARWIWKERISAHHWLGVMLIILGIIALGGHA
ncbi:4-amino-4-deoxy-L-arabinose-phosphoundecaprenol flippase subunit ArnE [Enterobacter sp. Ap-1006]|uniref:4-amino-4-deoxy-L-arabinose-phosphoundecaprenol flippase subunit ArnE n=1 Tax=Enterobacter sp. Ap-1006 TaxID=2608345 RepID=UPI001420F1E5|nr:4-amino-4-deoxy-L-arabinose-phosphoundecaprenol flippase subunit ArnE [Enterobacter sp. Ap-1006]NIF47606.1 4-amino-4-deoxy-L-arabinose-phosphoundecaprenol flippase subunit ArnE [Enterobacter sp. Ap-1006]